MAQRDLLVLLPHGVLTHPHLGKDEGGILVRGLRIGGGNQFDAAFQILMENPVHHYGNLVLPLLVDVEQADFIHFQFFPAKSDGLDDSGGKGAAAAHNGNNHIFDRPFLSVLRYQSFSSWSFTAW